jgi:hypothetical protein
MPDTVLFQELRDEPCAHEGKPCSPVVGDCLCVCLDCVTRRMALDPGYETEAEFWARQPNIPDDYRY